MIFFKKMTSVFLGVNMDSNRYGYLLEDDYNMYKSKHSRMTERGQARGTMVSQS